MNSKYLIVKVHFLSSQLSSVAALKYLNRFEIIQKFLLSLWNIIFIKKMVNLYLKLFFSLAYQRNCFLFEFHLPFSHVDDDSIPILILASVALMSRYFRAVCSILDWALNLWIIPLRQMMIPHRKTPLRTHPQIWPSFY